MKKGKMIVATLTLFVAIGAAYAFKAKTLPGDLWSFNNCGFCAKAPCEKTNITGNPCQNSPLYDNETCTVQYSLQAWTTDGGK